MKLNISIIILILSLVISLTSEIKSQTLLETAESIRKEYLIPEIGFAVVSSNQILEIQTLGFKQINSKIVAEEDDRFHLGSNTKAITGFIAALLVKQNKISWKTKFSIYFLNLNLKAIAHTLKLRSKIY